MGTHSAMNILAGRLRTSRDAARSSRHSLRQRRRGVQPTKGWVTRWVWMGYPMGMDGLPDGFKMGLNRVNPLDDGFRQNFDIFDVPLIERVR